MIEQYGEVVSRNRDSARVRCSPAHCEACEAGRGCGAGLFSRLVPRQPRDVPAANPRDFPVGTPVVVGVEESDLLSGALNLYGRPLVGLIAGALIGSAIGGWLDWGRDPAVLLGSAAGLAAALPWRRFPRMRLTILRRSGSR